MRNIIIKNAQGAKFPYYFDSAADGIYLTYRRAAQKQNVKKIVGEYKKSEQAGRCGVTFSKIGESCVLTLHYFIGDLLQFLIFKDADVEKYCHPESSLHELRSTFNKAREIAAGGGINQ